jgi:hypothetical protein
MLMMSVSTKLFMSDLVVFRTISAFDKVVYVRHI